jgi:hypothetical protein
MSKELVEIRHNITDVFQDTKEKGKSFNFDIVQPNKVTNARYHYNEVQENVLTCIMMLVQDQMAKTKDVQRDLFGSPSVDIDCNLLPSGAWNKAYAWKSILDLRKKDIDFEWVNQSGKTERVVTGLINTARTEKGSSIITVEISKWAIPYLLYWGKGVGGTIFDSSIALTLSGEYTKRLYKLCSRWKDKGGFTMPLAEFREMLCLEDKYSAISDLKKRVLETSKIKINESSDLEIDYDIVKRGGSKVPNFINFKIFANVSKDINDKPSTWYTFVWGCLNRAFPDFINDKAIRVCDELVRTQQLRLAFDRFTRLDDEVFRGVKKNDDFIRIMITFLKEDCKIKL